MKKTVPLIITFVSGMLMIVPYYIQRIESWQNYIQDWYKILSVFAFVLGVGSLIIVNGQKIQRLSAGWWYNASLLISLFVTLWYGIARGNFQEGTDSYYIFQYIFNPLSATMFSLLAFFIASAAFRAFKAKTFEATLLLLSAMFVMLGKVPPGEALWRAIPGLNHWEIGQILDYWVMGTFNAAGQRAILLGASIGLIAISLKILLGIEKAYLGSD